MKPTSDNHSMSRVLKYTGLFGGVQGFNVLMSMLRNKITALLLSTRGMGLISAYSQATELVSAATGMGIAFSAIQRIAQLHARGDSRALAHYVRLVRSWAMIVGIVGMMVVAVGARWWSIFYLDDDLATYAYVGASLLVLLSALIGAEVAILKGMRRIKSLALNSMLSALITLLITALIYLEWGSGGIVPALVLSSAATWALQLREAHRAVPYSLRLNSWRFLRRGRAMLALGVAYAAASVVDMGVQSAVRACIVRYPEWSGLEHLSGLEVVGVFSVGITLTVSYSRLIFTSIDAEYYPRLSSLTHDRLRQNTAVNRQIDVLVLLIAPFVLAFCLALPWLVQLLYSCEFLPATMVVMGAALHLLFKAVATPIAFLPLAHAHSRIYMLVEMLGSLLFVVCTLGGYYAGGLLGAGVGITLSHAFYLLLVWLAYSQRFGYVMERATLWRILVQLVLLVVGLLALLVPLGVWGMSLSIGTLLVSMAYSWHHLTRHMALAKRLRKWWNKRRGNSFSCKNAS